MAVSEPKVVENPPTALINLSKQFVESEVEIETAEQKVKDLKAKNRAIEKKLVDEMMTQQVKSFRTIKFGGFRSQPVVYPNVTDREALTAYVKKKKLDWLYTTSVNGQKLRGYVKELMEQGKKIPPGIEPYHATEVRRFK